jgi:nicotinate-nucleotide adenylyltransferase
VTARRIGLFGGTFDPPHNAHLALAHAALDALPLDELRWMPAGQPWQKSRAITPAVHREAMVRAAIAGEPRFVLERCELERNGPTYTIDTVRALQARGPAAQWFLVLGADQLAGLQTWHDWRALVGLVTLAVANRPGEHPALDPDVQRVDRRDVPMPLIDVSASEIRARRARGLPIHSMVPPAVAGYIETHALYGS